MTKLALVNANILDVETGKILPDASIVVEGETISEVSQERYTGSAAQVVDLGGAFVMPGLCDAHVHVTASTAHFASLARLAPSYVTAQSGQILDAMLMRGFTTVRDAGGADHGLARALEEGLIAGPRLLFCGKALSQTGGHGDMREPGEGAVEQRFCGCGLGYVCDGADAVRKACREIIRTGAHHIKLMLSGGVSSPTDRISSTQFSIEEITAAVEETAAAGLYTMAHAYTPAAIRRAVETGVRSIEHGNLLDAPTARLIREHSAFLVPTLVTYHALAREGAQAGLEPAMIDKVGEVLDAGLQALQIASDEGLDIVFGSDLLGTMHDRQLDEFALRAEVQTPLEVIQGATCNAARLFNMNGKIGCVAPGAYADLLVFAKNPAENIDVLVNAARSMQAMVFRGKLRASQA